MTAADLEGPEGRAALLAEAIRHSAPLPGPITTSALFKHLMAWTELPEERCGGAIYDTLFFLAASGLYEINTRDSAGAMVIGAGTVLTPSRRLTGHIHSEAFT